MSSLWETGPMTLRCCSGPGCLMRWAAPSRRRLLLRTGALPPARRMVSPLLSRSCWHLDNLAVCSSQLTLTEPS